MKDLNFFESYHKKNEKKLDKDIISYGLAIFFIMAMLIYTFFNFIKINRLNKEVSTLKQEVEIRKSNSKINEILEKEKEVSEFTDRFNKLKKLDDSINSTDLINEKLLDAITARVPETVFLNSMIFNPNLISIEGIAKDKKSISDFEYRLCEIDYFDDIFIPAISFDKDYYSFSINIIPREAMENGHQDNN